MWIRSGVLKLNISAVTYNRPLRLNATEVHVTDVVASATVAVFSATGAGHRNILFRSSVLKIVAILDD